MSLSHHPPSLVLSPKALEEQWSCVSQSNSMAALVSWETPSCLFILLKIELHIWTLQCTKWKEQLEVLSQLSFYSWWPGVMKPPWSRKHHKEDVSDEWEKHKDHRQMSRGFVLLQRITRARRTGVSSVNFTLQHVVKKIHEFIKFVKVVMIS